MRHLQTVKDLFEEIHALVSGMLDAVRAQQYPKSRLAHAHTLLESLPLTSSDYLVHKRRLISADEYCRSAEYGAAAFELRLVCKSMGRSAAAQVEFQRTFLSEVQFTPIQV